MKILAYLTLLSAVVFGSNALSFKGTNANGTCMVVNATIMLDISYIEKDNKTTKTIPLTLEEAVLDSYVATCGDKPSLELRLNVSDVLHNLTVTFANNSGTSQISEVEFVYKPGVLPNASVELMNETLTSSNASMNWNLAPVNNLYMCMAHDKRMVDSNLTIAIADAAIQVFNIVNDTVSAPSECAQDMTTVEPNTTVTNPVTTASAPTTTPVPEDNFKVGNGTLYCIVADLGVQFTIPYTKSNNETANAVVSLPNTTLTTVSGTCGDTTQTLNVMFYSGWEFGMMFTKSGSDYMMSNISLTWVIDNNFPDALNSTVGTKSSVALMSTDTNQYLKSSVGSYYMCKTTTNLALQDNVKIDLLNVEVVAFKTDNSTSFDPNGKLTECSQDEETSNIVPIAVGAALAGLVVIVLIAYLIGRRTNRKGYQSV